MLVSYAQNFEDVLLWRALKHVGKGYYIDIGAADPVSDSVSLVFHERGWRGIHIEPLADKAAALRTARPGDTVLEAAIGENAGTQDFYVVNQGCGISTCDPSIADRHRDAGFSVERQIVPCVRLDDVFNDYVRTEIHWLKIDVEGLEGEVIRSWQPSSVRPWIVVVESTRPMEPTPNHEIWEGDLLDLGYSFALFDGLNRFYVSNDHPELAAALTCGANVFDGFALPSWHAHVLPSPPPPPPTQPPLTAPAPPPLAPRRKLKHQVLRLFRVTCGPTLRWTRLWLRRKPWLRARLLPMLQARPRFFNLLYCVAEISPQFPQQIAHQVTPPVSHSANAPPRPKSVQAAHFLVTVERLRKVRAESVP